MLRSMRASKFNFGILGFHKSLCFSQFLGFYLSDFRFNLEPKLCAFLGFLLLGLK